MKLKCGFSLLETLVFIFLISAGIAIIQQTLLQLIRISDITETARRDNLRHHAEQWIMSQTKHPAERSIIKVPCPEKPICRDCEYHVLEVYLSPEATGVDWYYRIATKERLSPANETWIGPFRIPFNQL